MTCPDCTQAETKRHWGGYHARCQGCKVRALANGLQFWASLRQRAHTDAYRGELHDVFGPENIAAGHAAVKAEHARMQALSNSKKPKG